MSVAPNLCRDETKNRASSQQRSGATDIEALGTSQLSDHVTTLGTECLSAPLGQGGSPQPPSGGSHSGSHEAGCLVPGRVGLGAHQGLGLLGLRKASEGEGGGRLRRHLETQVQPGLVAPPAGHSQEATRRHGVKSRCLYSGCFTWSLSQAWTAP